MPSPSANRLSCGWGVGKTWFLAVFRATFDCGVRKDSSGLFDVIRAVTSCRGLAGMVADDMDGLPLTGLAWVVVTTGDRMLVPWLESGGTKRTCMGWNELGRGKILSSLFLCGIFYFKVDVH